jgi:rSAM/selenodomain-associated transferase 1
MGDVLAVFVKEPRAGAVKTRLAAAVGAERAAGLYRALAEAEIAATSPRADEYERVFFFAPPGSAAALRGWLGAETMIAQADGDLGARMSAAFGEAFARGARRVALIGTDVPWLTRGTVVEAFRQLDGHDVVLGPAEDGGYYLIALDRPRPALFEHVAWSTPTVLADTLARAATLGLRVRRLASMPDVDTLDDVRRHWERLRSLLPPPLRAALGPIVEDG